VSIPAGFVLVLKASGSREVIAAVIYWLALSSQFGVSAAYHLGMWSEIGRERMRTLDHATIFVLIAGSYTPFCLLVLHGAAAIVVLVIVWTGAALGIAMKVYRVDLHVVSGFLYLGLGWAAVIVFPAFLRDLSTTELALMIAGGLLYSGGALVLALHGRIRGRGRSATTRSGTPRRSARRRVSTPRSFRSSSRRDLQPRSEARSGMTRWPFVDDANPSGGWASGRMIRRVSIPTVRAPSQ
jgi:hemolysin III